MGKGIVKLRVGAFWLVLSTTGAWAQNVIQQENAKPGDADWGLTALSDTPTVEGYASATSVNRGETIRFFVSSAAPTYKMTIYRLGWYGGTGARKMMSVTLNGSRQPMPTPDPQTGMIDANWAESYRLTIPSSSDKTDWATGVYLAKLTPSSGTESYIMFVVRDDSSPSTYVFQSATNTAQAYNNWGGKSLYAFNSTNGAARKVSYNRPYRRQAFSDTGSGQFLSFEINFLRFMEREGYDVSYLTNIDVHADASRLLNHRAFLVAGHDEYWTYEMRAGVQAARGRGVHLGFFSGNQTYWQARLEPSPRTGDPNRTLVGYKDFSQSEDPYALDGDLSNDKYITVRFRDIQRLFGVNDPVAQPENSLVGVM
ncbi:MAG: N,N-dimethylformamidase beta subunit family domain-containing protein, partial [Ramlibacter sp.]